MKYFSLIFLFCFLNLSLFSQCNTDVTICTSGEAGPFTFVNASQEVGTCQSFLNGINSPNYGYILLYITESGPLSLLIDGNSNGGFIDVSIFNIPAGDDPCDAITNNANEIGCNFASDLSGCNQFGTFFPCASSVPSPFVNEGDVIMIVVEDYSSQQANFTIELGPSPNAQTGSLDAEILPIEDLSEDDFPFAVSAVVGGGTWTADCGDCIDENSGIFDPSIAGIGTWEICHYIGESPCEDSDCETITINPTLGGCGDVAVDTGGEAGDYGNSQNFVYTFCTDELSQNVALTFSEFDLEEGNDFMEIYQGPDSTFPLLGIFTGTNSPGIVTSDNGCLTIVFTSNETITSSGWVADFSCIPPCQDIEGVISIISDAEMGPNGEILICQGQEITLSGEGNYPENNTYYFQSDETSTFDWDFGDTSIATGSEVSHTYSADGVFLVQLQITDVLDCTNDSTIDITVVVAPTPIFTGTGATNDEICIGEQNELTGNYSTNQVSSIIDIDAQSWNFDPSIVSSTDSTILVEPLSIGEHCYTYQISNSLGCEYDTTICFTVISLQDAGFILEDFCENSENQANITGATGGEFSFEEIVLDGATINSITGEINNGVAGSTYTIVYTTPGPCSNSSTETVTVIPLDDASFIFEDYCSEEINLPVISGILGGEFSFSIPVIDTANINSNTGEISEGTIGETYFVEYSTGGTCPNSNIEEVTINEEISVIDIVETCELNQTEYSVSFTIVDGDVSTYFVAGGGTVVDNVFTSDLIPSGESYSFSVSDGNSCNTVIVEGEETCFCLATANLSADIDICEGDQGFLNIELEGDSPWEIEYTINEIPQSPITVNTSSYDFPVTVSGAYNLTSVSDQYCEGITQGIGSVSFLESPTASLVGSYLICSNSLQELAVNVTGSGGWELFYEIDGVPQTPLSNEDSPIIIEGNLAGNYELISIEDSNCFSLTTGVATIDYYSPIAIEINGDFDICIGAQTLLSGLATGETGSDYSYSWYESGELISSYPTESISPEATSNYELEVVSTCGIVFSEAVTVNIHPFPEVSFELDPVLLCEGENTTALITNTTNQNMLGNCSWEINNDNPTSCNQVVYTFDSPGFYDVGLTVESPFGCSSSLVKPNFVVVNPSPISAFSYTPENPTLFNNVIDFDNLSEGANSYFWNFENMGTSTEVNPNQAFFENENGFYNFDICLTAINEMGCENTICSILELEVELLVYVPTAFTPNNDFINDIFKPVITGNDPSVYEFSIYNSWGEKIYSTNDYTQGWNGAYHGIVNDDKNQDKYYVQEEVYNWVIELKKDASADIQTFKGLVTVIR